MEALEKLNEPLSTVLRNGEVELLLPVIDLVIAEEGNTINADGEVHSNDFSVNESLLTGEPYAVFKSEKQK
jgi:Ca2+-transporting ATPase